MADMISRTRTFLTELKRRNVYKVGLVYLVVAVASLEFLDVVVPTSRLPDWSEAFFLSLAVLGFPMALVLAWAFEITPEGMKRTEAPEAPGRSAETPGPSPPAPAGLESASPPEPDRAAEKMEPTPSAAAGPASTGPRTGGSLDPATVAVLPFANRSGTDEADPFAAGLHDDLLTELSQRRGLTVIARNSVRGMADEGRDMKAIALELGAGTLVEGGVQMAGDRVRLNIKVIDGGTSAHRWAERYDRELSVSDIFDLQTELAKRIAESVTVGLELPGATAATPGEDPPAAHGEAPTQDLEAYRLFATGRARFGARTEAGLREATEYFQRAVRRDPAYAPAWAGLASATILLADYRHVDPDEALARAREAARTALSLNPESAEAHAALGNLSTFLQQCSAAARHQARAIELRPSFAGAHVWLCWAHLLLGAPELAAEAGQRAVRLDPLDPEGRSNLAMAYLGCGRAEEARVEARRAVESGEDFDYAGWAEALALQALGRADAARNAMNGLTERWAEGWPVSAAGVEAARRGDLEAAQRSAAGMKDERPFHSGLVLLALGEVETAAARIRVAAPWTWDEALALRYGAGDLSRLRGSQWWSAIEGALDREWDRPET